MSSTFGIVVLIAVVIILFGLIFFSICVLCCKYLKKCRPQEMDAPPNRNGEYQRNERTRTIADRQGNIYTISDDNALNTGPPRFADFFYLEPGSEEAARIRAQLEKDDKELPSYDEVMQMTSLPQDPIAMESGTARLGVSTTSIATTTTIATDISIPAPPYTEVDPNATIITAATAAATSSAIAGTPSTSRAAASVVVANTITTTTTSA